MTLIFEIEDTLTNRTVLVSDCLVSMNDQPIKQPNNFPMHVGSGWSIDTAGVGLSSKLYVGADRVILSAGNVSRIGEVASLFSRASSLEDFRNSFDIFYENKREQDQFLYKMKEHGKWISSDTNCLRFRIGHLKFFVGGSGGDYLFRLLKDQKPNHLTAVEVLAIQLLGQIMRLEFRDYDFPIHKFGGAYEICVLEKNGIRRVPYTIIDSLGAANLASDGVYDILSRQVTRVIFCCPVREGSVFVVAKTAESRGTFADFFAKELGATQSMSFTTKELEDLLISHKAEFTISLLRHSDVNVAVFAKNFVEVGLQKEGGFSLVVDIAGLERCELDYYS